MRARTTLFILVGIVCFFSNSSSAQGKLEATLSPYSPSVPPLSGSALVYTPDTSGVGPYYSVSYLVTVNTNSPVFTVGRIAGGSTAWAFDLSTPLVSGDSLIYSGLTDMGAFQISDMLSNLTDFELYAYAGDGSVAGLAFGSLVAVPEPSSNFLLLSGFVFALSLRKRANPNNPSPP